MALRTCDHCGKSYHRRNLTEVWDRRNPGARTGWHKTLVRLCLACMSESQMRRMLMVVAVSITPHGEPRAVRRAS
jgi:hypothetical protein